LSLGSSLAVRVLLPLLLRTAATPEERTALLNGLRSAPIGQQLELARRLLVIDPEHGDVREAVADVHRRAGQAATADKILALAQWEVPSDEQLRRRSSARRRTGDLIGAGRDLEALAAAADVATRRLAAVELLAAGRVALALDTYSSVIAKTGDGRIVAEYIDAALRHRAQDHARRGQERAGQVDRHHDVAALAAARVALLLEEPDLAQQHLTTAREHGDQVEVGVLQAAVMEQLGDFEGAGGLLVELAKSTRDAKQLRLIAQRLAQRGDVDAAVVLYRRSAAGHDPVTPMVEAALALQRDKRPRDGLALLEEVEALGDHPDAHAARGTIRNALGDPDGAIDAFRRAVELRPANVKWRRRLVELLLQRPDLDEAELHAQRFFELAPEDPTALHLVALVRARRSDPEPALRAVASSQDIDAIYAYLGALIDGGNEDLAASALERVVGRMWTMDSETSP
jgi:tetratricopeptide (TPR) repeat protein